MCSQRNCIDASLTKRLEGTVPFAQPPARDITHGEDFRSIPTVSVWACHDGWVRARSPARYVMDLSRSSRVAAPIAVSRLAYTSIRRRWWRRRQAVRTSGASGGSRTTRPPASDVTGWCQSSKITQANADAVWRIHWFVASRRLTTPSPWRSLVPTCAALRRLIYQLLDIGLPVHPFWRRGTGLASI